MEEYKFIKDQILSLTQGKIVKKNGCFLTPILLIVIGIVALVCIHYFSEKIERSPFLMFASVMAFCVVCGGVFLFMQTKSKYVYVSSGGKIQVKKIVLAPMEMERYAEFLGKRRFNEFLKYEIKENSEVYLEIWVDQFLTIGFVQLMYERNRIPFPISDAYQLSTVEVKNNCELFCK